eukprot:6966_1
MVLIPYFFSAGMHGSMPSTSLLSDSIDAWKISRSMATEEHNYEALMTWHEEPINYIGIACAIIAVVALLVFIRWLVNKIKKVIAVRKLAAEVSAAAELCPAVEVCA